MDIVIEKDTKLVVFAGLGGEFEGKSFLASQKA